MILTFLVAVVRLYQREFGRDASVALPAIPPARSS
jgi:hypothetical protein